MNGKGSRSSIFNPDAKLDISSLKSTKHPSQKPQSLFINVDSTANHKPSLPLSYAQAASPGPSSFTSTPVVILSDKSSPTAIYSTANYFNGIVPFSVHYPLNSPLEKANYRRKSWKVRDVSGNGGKQTFSPSKLPVRRKSESQVLSGLNWGAKLSLSRATLELPPKSVSGIATMKDVEEVSAALRKFVVGQLVSNGIGFLVTDYTRNELLGISIGLFYNLGLITSESLLQKIFHFVLIMSENYSIVPYHSFSHAVDVTFMTYLMLTELKAAERFSISKNEAFAVLVASLGHDVLHPGTNNQFQMNTKATVAINFSNQSVLENQSIEFLLETLESLNLVEKYLESINATRSSTQRHPSISTRPSNQLPSEKKKHITNIIQSTILHTDMAFHFQLLDELKSYGSSISSHDSLKKEIPKNTLLSFILHGADISNGVRPLHICIYWSSLITREFINQNQMELALNLDPSFAINQDPGPKQDLQIAQLGLDFNEIIAKPYFTALGKLLGTDTFEEHIAKNGEYWKNECNRLGNRRILTDAQMVCSPISPPRMGDEKFMRKILSTRRVSVAAGTIEIFAAREMQQVQN